MRVYWEEEMDYMATEAQADAEYAHNVGYDRPEQAWILSDRDVWYANPFYKGIPHPHPEDDIYDKTDLFFFNSEKALDRCADPDIIAKRQANIEADLAARYAMDDEVPF